LPSHADQLTIDARRSLRASRERRGAALRRRRLLRGRRAALVCAGVFAVTAGGALAAPGDTDRLPRTTVKAAQRALDVQADGVVGPKTKRAIRRHQREEGLRVDGVLGPATLHSLGIGARDDAARTTGDAPSSASGGAGSSDPPAPAQAPAGVPPAPTGEAAATLERIAACESGGDPTAVSSDGTYRGKYQFDRSTWEHVGGTGDPAQAPEAEQDARAAQLLEQRGTAPWPVCGG
jgi:peptidoglycan hydrolase-like protein with peptidoglycan-binding domain